MIYWEDWFTVIDADSTSATHPISKVNDTDLKIISDQIQVVTVDVNTAKTLEFEYTAKWY
jgi:hypothetical protein